MITTITDYIAQIKTFNTDDLGMWYIKKKPINELQLLESYPDNIEICFINSPTWDDFSKVSNKIAHRNECIGELEKETVIEQGY